jgi:hypothetical protein
VAIFGGLDVAASEHDIQLDDVLPVGPPNPEWGESLVREYDRKLTEYQALHNQDRPGLPCDERTDLAIAKLAVFESAAVTRAKAVNWFLTLLRWCREDSPGILESILSPVIDASTQQSFDAVAKEIVKTNRRRVA